MDHDQALKTVAEAAEFFPEPYRAKFAAAAAVLARTPGNLEEASVAELFGELRRRHISCVFAGSRTDGMMVKMHGGPLYDCVGLAEVAKDMIKAQLRVYPLEDRDEERKS
jgi:hypothetical protein